MKQDLENEKDKLEQKKKKKLAVLKEKKKQILNKLYEDKVDPGLTAQGKKQISQETS